ncbi:MAG: 2-C-methyl-D-erythritol 2,4-cyclodiphosphate synthase [Planctomycetota bacterium]
MIGIGFDIHRLIKGREFILGGIKIDYPRGLKGHSDADVLLHALIDALLGASKLGDIGNLFPDTDPCYTNIPSSILLKKTLDFIRSHKKRFKMQDVDSIIFLEEPKLGRKKKVMANNIARLLNIPINNVNVKAKTMEGLGPIGHKSAVAALVLVNLA